MGAAESIKLLLLQLACADRRFVIDVQFFRLSGVCVPPLRPAGGPHSAFLLPPPMLPWLVVTLVLLASGSPLPTAASSATSAHEVHSHQQQHPLRRLLTTSNPYHPPIHDSTGGSLVFQMGVPLSRASQAANSTYFNQLLTDVRIALGPNLYDVDEEFRVFMTGPVWTNNYAIFSVRIGPPVLASTTSSIDLWVQFYAHMTANPPFAPQVFPILATIDRRMLALASYACSTGDVRASYVTCGQSDSDNTGARNSWIIAVAVIVSVAVLICLGFICLRLAKKRPVDGNDAAHPPSPAAVQLQGLGVHPLDAAGQTHYYPGAPNRLSDGLPANVAPVKYGDDPECAEADPDDELEERPEGAPAGAPEEPTQVNEQSQSLLTVTLHVQP